MTRNRRKKRDKYFTYWASGIVGVANDIFTKTFDGVFVDSLFEKKNNKVKFKYITRKGNGV